MVITVFSLMLSEWVTEKFIIYDGVKFSFFGYMNGYGVWFLLLRECIGMVWGSGGVKSPAVPPYPSLRDYS